MGIETMEMRLRRHAKGDGPWEEEHFVMPEASGGTIRREVCQKGATQILVESLLLFVGISILLALVLNVDISYGCRSCNKTQVTSFSIYQIIYSEIAKGKGSASVTLPLDDALQTLQIILSSPHSLLSFVLLFLAKLTYNEGF